MKNIFIASDHAGFLLKSKIIDYLKNLNLQVTDLGTESDESTNYPIFAQRVVNDVLKFQEACGILICGTGIGMSIVSNRYRGIRAALCVTEEMALYSRLHNDANILVLGARIIKKKTAFKCVDTFLKTPFEGERHQLRLDLIDKKEE